jgi:hypothetical protein
MANLALVFDVLARDNASKTFDKIGRSAESSAKGIKGHLGSLGGILKGALKGDVEGLTSSLTGGISKLGPYGAAAGAALGAVSAAVIPLAKESIDAFKNVAGETLKLQRVMGGTAEDASRMRFAFHETGVDATTGAKAMGIFSKNLVGFNGKTGAAIPILKQFGINAKDTNGHLKPMAQLLPQIADKFAKMPNGAEKSALALKLFGKGGLALLPFLNRGADGIAKLTEESDKFGLTLSGKDLDALKRSRAAHKEWDAAMEGAKVRIGAQLLPMVTRLTTWFTAKMIPVIVKAGQWVQAHGDTIQRVAGQIGRALVIMVKVWVVWEKAIYTVVVAVAKIFGWLWTNGVRPVITFILRGFASVVSGIGHFLQALGHVPHFEWAKTAGDKMLIAASGARALADGLDRVANHRNLTVTVNTYYKTHGQPQHGGAATIGSGAGIKGFATGVRNFAGGFAVVGESGPELVRLPKGSDVYTASESRAMSRGGNRVDLSEASLQRLAAILSGVQTTATISASSVDRAMGGTLR